MNNHDDIVTMINKKIAIAREDERNRIIQGMLQDKHIKAGSEDHLRHKMLQWSQAEPVREIRCTGITSNGSRCNRLGKYGGLCKTHRHLAQEPVQQYEFHTPAPTGCTGPTQTNDHTFFSPL